MNDYDYYIVTKEILRPVGDNRYFAKLNYFILREPGIARRLDHLAFGETWGRTEAEAHEKMRNKVEGWIAQR